MKGQQLLLSAHQRFNTLLSDLAIRSDITPFLNQVILSVEEFMPSCKVSILTLDADTQTLHSGASNHLPAFYNRAIEGIAIGEHVGSCGAAAYLNQAVIVEDINTHPNWQPYLALTQQANLHSCWSVPFSDSHNNVMGTFAIYHHEPKCPTQVEQEIINVAALITSVAMEKVKLEAKLRYKATHDEVTGLHNRAYLNDIGESFISLCHRKRLNCSLLFIDLNNFKRVNDKLGHKAGDELLVEVAKIIKNQTRSCDISARFGGDEFIVLMENTKKLDGQEVAARIHTLISNIANDAILELGFGASIGVSTLEKEQLSLNQLIYRADQAMYYAKQNSLGIYCPKECGENNILTF
jgi:diguanylate cyclase (GGDEF)-like protein